MSENEKVVEVEIDKIKIPAIRVTSFFDKEELDALIESLKVSGQRLPIMLYEVDGELWLADGLNRIEAAKRLGWKTIKAIIRKGTMSDVDFDNLITAAVRGRNNPALFAKVVRRLRDEYRLSWNEIAKRTGYSVMTIKNYYDVASLPEQVLQLIAAGKLSISKAVLLLELPDPRYQIECAEEIAKYGYNEYQSKEHVRYYLSLLEDQAQPIRPTLKKPDSESSLICDVCQEVIRTEAQYYWFHPECWEIVLEALRQYVHNSEQKKTDASIAASSSESS